MKFKTILEIYDLISSGMENSPSRKQSFAIRRKALSSIESKFIKIAFDTRRINQETDYNPRRGLQNYHRSEQFVSDSLSIKLEAFTKILKVVNSIKLEYGRDPEWQDSYTRILASAINKGLRTDQLDGDFSDAQPSVASLDYLQELMYVRYRMTPEDLISTGETQIRKILLNKDEILSRKGMGQSHIISPSDVTKYSYDNMIDKILVSSNEKEEPKKSFPISQIQPTPIHIQTESGLGKLFEVKATPDSPEVERTVTITIKDKISKNG